jgi:hypothetical protein
MVSVDRLLVTNCNVRKGIRKYVKISCSVIGLRGSLHISVLFVKQVTCNKRKV